MAFMVTSRCNEVSKTKPSRHPQSRSAQGSAAPQQRLLETNTASEASTCRMASISSIAGLFDEETHVELSHDRAAAKD
jgi:hypothetical protein